MSKQLKQSKFLVGGWTMAVVLGTSLSWGCDIGYDPIGDDGAEEGLENDVSGSGESESNDTSEPNDTDTGDETGGEITNACGTFDPNDTHGESTIPQDPDDPVIIAACTALCEVQLAEVAECSTSVDACLMHCKMRSCEVCPDTLAPLVDCETAMFTGAGCNCTAEGVDCEIPNGCGDLENQTGFCGG